MSTVQVTQYGAPLPKIVSQANWAQISTTVDAASNNGISYHQLLCCDHHSAADMWPCDLLSTGLPLACDPFAKSRVWSPRRSHVALTVEYVAPGTTQPVTQIVVLGT